MLRASSPRDLDVSLPTKFDGQSPTPFDPDAIAVKATAGPGRGPNLGAFDERVQDRPSFVDGQLAPGSRSRHGTPTPALRILTLSVASTGAEPGLAASPRSWPRVSRSSSRSRRPTEVEGHPIASRSSGRSTRPVRGFGQKNVDLRGSRSPRSITSRIRAASIRRRGST